MDNDFRTIAFNDNCETEMLAFVDKHWDRVIGISHVTEYQHTGASDAYLVKIKLVEKPKRGFASISDILPNLGQ